MKEEWDIIIFFSPSYVIWIWVHIRMYLQLVTLEHLINDQMVGVSCIYSYSVSSADPLPRWAASQMCHVCISETWTWTWTWNCLITWQLYVVQQKQQQQLVTALTGIFCKTLKPHQTIANGANYRCYHYQLPTANDQLQAANEHERK